MKIVTAIGIIALVLCASASAKFEISVAASDATPAVGQPVTVIVRSEQRLNFNLRLIAVAPGRDIFRVVATITGDTRYPDPNVARDGFEVHLARITPHSWRGVARFRSTGRWRVVVPNEAPAGVVIPAGVARLTFAVHQPPASEAIVVFGLVPEFIGRGFGGPFLTLVTRLAWAMPAPTRVHRVWLQTYSSDHPHAITSYIARGFRVFQSHTRRVGGESASGGHF